MMVGMMVMSSMMVIGDHDGNDGDDIDVDHPVLPFPVEIPLCPPQRASPPAKPPFQSIDDDGEAHCCAIFLCHLGLEI